MPTPRRAYALDVLLAEINRHAPHRSKVSDGWIGDAAHRARGAASDHNPDPVTGAVRAADITDDPDGGLDGSELAQKLAHRLGKHPALKSGAYLIHNARIISFDRLAEGWRPYAGINAHRHHVHVSVSKAAAGYDSKQAFNLWSTVAAPKPPAKPTALVRLLHDWVDDRSVDWDSFDLLIDRGQQPLATDAKEARDAIDAAMKKFVRAHR